MNLQQLSSFSHKNVLRQTPAGKPQPLDSPPPDQFTFSKDAFVDGASAASELVTMGAGVGAGAIGGFALGASAVTLAAAGLAIAGPAVTVLAIVGGACGAVMAAVGGGTLAEKASKKFGEWGSKLATRLGLSEKTGEALGRTTLAVGLGASVGFGAPVALMALASGLVNKSVGNLIDAFRS